MVSPGIEPGHKDFQSSALPTELWHLYMQSKFHDLPTINCLTGYFYNDTSLTIPHSIMSLVSCAYSPRLGFWQRITYNLHFPTCHRTLLLVLRLPSKGRLCDRTEIISYFLRKSTNNFLSASQRLYPFSIFFLIYSFSPIMEIAFSRKSDALHFSACSIRKSTVLFRSS